MPGSFFDTNVLVYFASGAPRKADQAEALLLEGGAISVQVLNELALVCRRRFDFSWSEIAEMERRIRSAVAVGPLDLGTHDEGLRIAERYRLRIYDSMLIAAALMADCDVFWSEDLQHGQVFDGQLTVRNPFG